jgi:hypothetical protein
MAGSFLIRKSGGLKIQQTLESFRVASGENITAGTFVDYILINDEKFIIPANTNIFGLAKTSGLSGQTIDVYIK